MTPLGTANEPRNVANLTNLLWGRAAICQGPEQRAGIADPVAAIIRHVGGTPVPSGPIQNLFEINI